MAEGRGMWVAIQRFAWLILLGLGVVLVGALFWPPLNQLRQLQLRVNKLEDQNRDLEEQVRRLQAKQEQLLTDPKAVEREARERGMARPGETIFRLVDSPTSPPAPPAPRKP